MGMTKRDFVALANAHGTVLKHNNVTDPAKCPTWVADMIHADISVCRASNSAFSVDTFVNHLWDVARGVRDIDGRLVKS